MNSLVASALPGRVRLRGPVLRQARALAQARSALQAQPGVICVQTNARVGSLLLHYDAATLPQPQAEALLAAAVQAALQPAANDDAGAAACPSSPAPRQPRQNRRAAASAARAAHLSVPAAPPAPHPHHAPARNVINRWAKRGMLLTLGASLALAATGAKRGHAALGGVFVLLLGVHLAVHRRRLLK